MSSVRDVPTVANMQGGVFTSAQAQAEGWSGRQVRRRLSAGRWEYVAGQAMAAAPAPPVAWTPFQLGVAAQLTVPDAVTSHQTAGVLHGFPLDNDSAEPAHVISQRRHDGCRNIKIHRLRVDPGEIETLSAAIWITSARRTALDLLATLPLAAALDLWAWVSSRKIADVRALESAIVVRHKW